MLFQDLGPNSPPIGGLTFQTDLNGFDGSYLTFAPHSIKIAVGGLDWTGGQFLSIKVQFVPEPAGLLLIITALPATLARRQRRT